MDPIERQIALLNALARARRPVTWDDLAQWFPDDYGEDVTPEARDKKWKRDRAALAKMDQVVRHGEEGEDCEAGGWMLDREETWLKETRPPPHVLAFVRGAALAYQAQGGFAFRS